MKDQQRIQAKITSAEIGQGWRFEQMRHYTISKYNPRTGERIVLHERVPEGIVDWLSEQPVLSSKEKASGFEIVKESEGRPIERQIISAPAQVGKRANRSPLKHRRSISAGR